MPRFEPLEVRATLPTSVPVPTGGTGGAAVGQALERLGGTLTAIGQTRQRETDRLRTERTITEGGDALSRRFEALRDEIRRTTDPEALPGLVDERLDGVVGDLADVDDPVARETLRRQAATWARAARNAADEHRFTLEVDRGRAALVGALDTATRLAAEDPDPAVRAFQTAEVDRLLLAGVDSGYVTASQAAAERGRRQAELRTRVSGVHVTTLGGFLAAGEADEADAYFEAHADELTPEDRARATTMRAEGRFRITAQRETDALYGAHLQDRDGAIAAARQALTGPMEDDVVRRLHLRFDEDTQAATARNVESVRIAESLIEGGGRLDQLHPEHRAQLTSAQIQALQKREADLARGIEPETKWDVYYRLKTEASTKATQRRFLRTDLYATHRNDLADAEFKELTGLQAALLAKDEKAEATLDGYRTTAQIVNDSLAAAGIDPTPKPSDAAAKQVAAFRRRVDEEVAAWKRATGKKAIPTDQVQGIVDQLLVKGRESGTGWFGTDWFARTPRRFEAAPGAAFVVEDVAEVPPADRRQIEGALRQRGIPVTDARVLDLYNRGLARSREPQGGR